MQTWICTALPLTLLAVGCGAQTTEIPAEDISQPIQIAPSCALDYPTDPFTVQSARVVVEDDLLAVRVGFSGGCEPHDFFVCWRDSSFLETDPVRARLAVFHDAHGDRCEAYLTQERYIDLTPLREAFQTGYGQHGTIIIDVAIGLDGTEHSAEYTF